MSLMEFESSLDTEKSKKADLTAKVGEIPSVGRGIGFERIRRITGYLVGDLNRFNNAKRAEEKDRVKHDKYTTSAK